ncbi:hypothetical protein Pla175_06480 [Pirellulimonas nuda]|uniref:Putative restriction endonuclease domain-containing protein n=1 Tax=Pirellulimonas nuda TaxID=2528009 RepID=A0A518D770_9BACT|nr:Uma2 family endonuclease [Pirellulimonas nuda]QDU87289.1 hypothetical protein Pla175_06480 [Pirellulimonas nuda]
MSSILDHAGMSITGVEIPPTPLPAQADELTWDIARLFPRQGSWTVEQYLQLTETVNWPMEFTDGVIEFLPMPTIAHQLLVRFLMDALRAFVEPRDLGVVLFGPLPTWLNETKYREPDVLFNTTARHEASDKYYHGADLVMEVVSPDDRSHTRDHEDKVVAYAAAGIQEYWIVDPQEQRVRVLTLQGAAYVELANVVAQSEAPSKLLDGFTLDVAAAFAAAKRK